MPKFARKNQQVFRGAATSQLETQKPNLFPGFLLQASCILIVSLFLSLFFWFFVSLGVVQGGSNQGRTLDEVLDARDLKKCRPCKSNMPLNSLSWKSRLLLHVKTVPSGAEIVWPFWRQQREHFKPMSPMEKMAQYRKHSSAFYARYCKLPWNCSTLKTLRRTN